MRRTKVACCIIGVYLATCVTRRFCRGECPCARAYSSSRLRYDWPVNLILVRNIRHSSDTPLTRTCRIEWYAGQLSVWPQWAVRGQGHVTNNTSIKLCDIAIACSKKTAENYTEDKEIPPTKFVSGHLQHQRYVQHIQLIFIQSDITKNDFLNISSPTHTTDHSFGNGEALHLLRNQPPPYLFCREG